MQNENLSTYEMNISLLSSHNNEIKPQCDERLWAESHWLGVLFLFYQEPTLTKISLTMVSYLKTEESELN